jgi:methyl-accepting chemotaxis protein
VHKVNNLVGEIASASNEQARGIEQIGTAMNQLNQVTQTNAASSEQAAAAAEELGAQAEEMNRMVDQLRALVGGANGNGAGHMHERRALAGPARKALPPAERNRSVKVAKPEHVIPLEDDDMKDF